MPFEANGKGMRVLSRGSFLFALLQSLCTAVLTMSGIRVAIGLTALAAASGIYAPATGWHQDAIRIPMLIIAAVGAVINLAVLLWIWHLRTLPSARWRQRELTAKEKRSERVQVVLAIVTLVLVGLETWTHPMVHRKGPPPKAQTSGQAMALSEVLVRLRAQLDSSSKAPADPSCIAVTHTIPGDWSPPPDISSAVAWVQTHAALDSSVVQKQ